jgi:hypothetical protein
MTEIHQFFTNQQTYLEGLRSLAQANQDTAIIKQMLQQNAEGMKQTTEALQALKAQKETTPK